MKKRVAIIGNSFRFPSTDQTRYWSDLLLGKDLVSSVEKGRWAEEAFLHTSKSHPGTSYTFAAGSIGDVAGFDAGFFGISPREAAQMDPQQRLLLEMSWEAFENAGIKPSSMRGSPCGVFIGIASADYSYRIADDLSAIDAAMATGNTASIAANRLSYFYDLRGPSMAIDTACSSSLVAFHQACRSIQSGESTHALAGGISLHLHPYGFIIFSKATMLSRQGRCRVFDASGDGYVRSEGGGIFLLKDYDTALADGNRILAVVAHSAVNTDGRKSGLTVPKAEAQAALIEAAYADAGIAPADIDYIEAHGTGTAVGDPIETRALSMAIGKKRVSGHPLPIGSVKSNLGHLEAASGIAGMVKALYSVRNRVVPATIGLQTPNPNIPFDDWNIEVVTANKALRPEGKLIVGVNSFGFGGANAHVIIESSEEPIALTPASRLTRELPIIVSGTSAAGLKASADALASHLVQHPEISLTDLSWQCTQRREWLSHRAVLYADSLEIAADRLAAFARDDEMPGGVFSGHAHENASGPAFVYSGNGSQWFGMGKNLLSDPVFYKAIRKIDALFRNYASFSLEDELAGKNGEGRFEYTEIAQPALFAIQVGITEMLRERGIFPLAVTGHSVGEVAAAWAAGALPLEEAVKVIYHRSRQQGLTKGEGQMTAVSMTRDAASQLVDDSALSDRVVIAGVNSPKGVTLAGRPDDLATIEEKITALGHFNKRLELDYAFHSPAMDRTEAGIRQWLADLKPEAGHTPFYSTVTGKLFDGPALDAGYWWLNIRNPVLFESAIRAIAGSGINVFIEVSPHTVLRSYINDTLKDAGVNGRIIATLTRHHDEADRVSAAAAQTMIAGGRVNWSHFFAGPGKFVDLPFYPWQKERHWHVTTAESLGQIDRYQIHPLLGHRLAQHDLSWENQIDVRSHPALADHVVGDAIVFPGAAYLELAIAAAQSWLPSDTVTIEELEILAPLLLSAERSKIVRVAIDSSDGSLTVRGKDQGADEPYVLHAKARILRQTHSSNSPEAHPLTRTIELPIRQPDFNRQSHAALTTLVGLDYGPAFQAIDHGWAEPGAATVVFELPTALRAEIAGYHLHPALLDCAFQLIIQFLRDDPALGEGIAFVPTKMGYVTARTDKATPCSARATLRRRSPHSLLADFTLFDQTGHEICSIAGARFRSIRLQKAASDPIRHLGLAFVPQPLGVHRPISAVAFATTRQALRETVRRCVLKGTHRPYTEEIDPLLDELCSRFTHEAFTRLNDSRPGEFEVTLQRLRQNHPENEALLDQLMTLALEDGWIEVRHGHSQLGPLNEQAGSAQDIWNSLLADCPDYFPIIHAVGRIGMHLSALIEGRVAFDTLFDAESQTALLGSQMLRGSGEAQLRNALSGIVKTSLATLPEGQRLSILEVSEAPGYFVQAICSSLDFDRADFQFASTAPFAVDQVQALFDQMPHRHATLINSEAPASEQSDIDLAVVSIDFLNMADALLAIRYAVQQLNHGGTLLIIGQHPARWNDFVFGGKPGWWLRQPGEQRLSRNAPLAFWLDLARQLGLTAPELLEFAPDAAAGPYLLLSQKPAAALPEKPAATLNARSWLVLADAAGTSSQLALQLCKNLLQRGDLAVTASAGDSNHIASLILDMRANYGSLDGIVHLAGLDVGLGTTSESADRVSLPVSRCATAAAILQACESTRCETAIWLVTANANKGFVVGPRQHPGDSTTAGIADAALWGFGRTMINEATNNRVRMIDLEKADAIAVAAQAIGHELDANDHEDEIAFSAGGQRFVPRLRMLAPDRAPGSSPDASGNAQEPTAHRLTFALPGQLRNLHWSQGPVTPPAEDELEIEVKATGLNFRDVMYALGLLADEAIENGFAGPTLGLEFSGNVSRVGSAVRGYAIGDKVVGFGPASFSNRVLTKSSAISHIPTGISFEAAATIPSTFFTAYYALHHLARLAPGEKLLIHGAAGGVGIAAIQIAKWRGAEIFASAGSDEKRDFLRLLGVDHIVDSRSLAYAEDIMAITQGKGIDVVLNSLAGEAINRNFSILKPFGRFLELGKRDFYENTKIGLRPFRNNITYFGIDADQLMCERPELTRSLFAEVMALFADGVLHALPYRAFEAEDIVEAFRFMQQSKQIGKIVVTYRNGIPSLPAAVGQTTQTLSLPADASYLVTGGLSGFGLRTAEWLAEKGARHLVLLSRSGPVSDEAQSAIAGLQARGVTVLARACDITDQARLSAVLGEAAKQLPPLRGIVHAAVVIDDGLVRNLDAAQIARVLAPKIQGAQHLHQLTATMPLDFFVLFSSATTLFGNPGQSAYVAANSWLEALARLRREHGLPATCVRWGAIDDVGFLARNQKIRDALQGRMGGAALTSAMALDQLEKMLLENRSDEGILGLDWRALSRFLPSAGAPKFSRLAREAGDLGSDEDASGDIERLLAELNDKELAATFGEMLKVEIGEILRVAPDKIDPNRSIYEMGLDSLMGVELVVALENRFGTRLPVMALSESPTISKLAERIIAQLRSHESGEAVQAENTLTDAVQKMVAVHAPETTPDERANITRDFVAAEPEPIARMIKS